MRRAVRRVTSIVLLVAAFWSLALGPEFDTPHRYDGDRDDPGLIGQVLFRWVDVGVTDAHLTFVPSTPTRCLPATAAARPQQIARVPLGSRAPPA
jgi:hypothetical protein